MPEKAKWSNEKRNRIKKQNKEEYRRAFLRLTQRMYGVFVPWADLRNIIWNIIMKRNN